MIEADGISLLERNDRFLEGDFVDYNGLPYDNTAAALAVLEWPLEKKLSTKSFVGLAN